MNVYYLLAIYGMYAGIKFKWIPLFRLLPTSIDPYLQNPYIVGVHCGWIMWVFMWWYSNIIPSMVPGLPPPVGFVQIAISVLFWCLSSAAFCFSLDKLRCSNDR